MRRRLFASIVILLACSWMLADHDRRATGIQAASRGATQPVGLDLEFVEGLHTPVPVIAGGPFFVDSITLRTRVEGEDENVLELLRTESDFSDLEWSGLQLERRSQVDNPDGTSELQEYYAGARWMGGEQRFTLSVKDASGGLLAGPGPVPARLCHRIR